MKRLWRVANSFDLGRTATFRVVAMALGLVSNLAVIAILTRQFGANSYAAFALVASFTNLLPFADLGLGASVINATADRNSGALSPEAFSHHLARARDYLVLVAIIIVAADLWITFAGAWPDLLGQVGDQADIGAAAGYTLACIAISIPLGLGSRLLQGMSRMATVVRIGMLTPGTQIVLVAPLFVFHAPASFYPFVPGTAYLVTAIVGFVIGLRAARPHPIRLLAGLRRALPDQPKLADTAIPFLLISLGLAAGFQSHRLLLAHFSGAGTVAEYSLVAQFTGPVLAVITVVGQNLWARYRGATFASRVTLRQFQSHVLVFIVLGLMGAVALVAVVPWAGSLISGGRVNAPVLVVLAAASYVIVTATHQPGAMMLNDPRGLWAQAGFSILVAGGTVVAIMLGAPALGAAAAYFGTALTMLVVQVLPTLGIAIRRLRLSQERTEG